MRSVTWRQVPESFLTTSRLWAARVLSCLWRPLVAPKPSDQRWAERCGPWGRPGGTWRDSSSSPAQSRAFTPVCLLTFLTPQGRSLANDSALCEPGSGVGAPGRPHTFPRSPGTQSWAPPGREQFPEARPTSGHEASLAELASGSSTQVCSCARWGALAEGSARRGLVAGQGSRSRGRWGSPARELGLCGLKV